MLYCKQKTISKGVFMNVKFDAQKLSKILEDVYQLLKTPISIFDGKFRFITSYPEGLTDFCALIRRDKKRWDRCVECDERACDLCQKTGETFSYVCHAGVMETVTPIKVEKLTVGYILFGQYKLFGENSDLSSYAKREEIDEKALASYYEKLTVLTQKQVDAICNILQSCVLTILLSQAILLKEDELAERIKEYIENNLDKSLTVEEICGEFFIGRQKLYAIFSENFNSSVKSYILDRKINKAKELLVSTDLTVTEIAEKTGFVDYNNFIQRFKKFTGKSPLKYRKSTI